MVDPEHSYETPDPSLMASIEHEAEKLGYLISRVDEMFVDRVRIEHREITVRHTRAGIDLMKSWLDKEISEEQYAERSADLAQFTSFAYDHLKMNHAHNTSRLNSMVLDAIERGKNQQDNLNEELNKILNGDDDTEEQ